MVQNANRCKGKYSYRTKFPERENRLFAALVAQVLAVIPRECFEILGRGFLLGALPNGSTCLVSRCAAVATISAQFCAKGLRQSL
jgi:hypothetical protein